MFRCLGCGTTYMKKESNSKCPKCNGPFWEKLDTFTADKFGVPIRTDEIGTHTKKECIRRGFDPDKCQWLLKPEFRRK